MRCFWGTAFLALVVSCTVKAREKVLDFPIYWAKGEPYTKFLPTNDQGEHGGWSCGQVAHAMILRYWSLKQKLHTSGTHFYYRHVNGERISADFNVPFRWNEMLPSLQGLSMSNPRVDPVADLAYRICIGTRTDWWDPDIGDWNRGYRYKQMLARYFGIDMSEYRRGYIQSWVADHSWDALYARINRDIDCGQPCELVIASTAGGIHEVVITGYREVGDHFEYMIHFGGNSYDPQTSYRLDRPIRGYDDPGGFKISWGIKPYTENANPPVYNTLLQSPGVLDWYNKGSVAWNGAEYAALLPVGHATDRKIVFQRISPTGLPTGSPANFTLDHTPDPRPAITWAGTAYAVVWSDMADDQDILRFNYLSPEGVKILSKDVLLGDATATPALVWTGNQCGMVWRNGYRVHFCRLDGDGNVLGSVVDLGRKESPDICWTGQEFGVSWVDHNNVNLHFARLNSQGDLLGTAQEFHLPDAESCRESAVAYADGLFGMAFVKYLSSPHAVVTFCLIDANGKFVENSLIPISDRPYKARDVELSYRNNVFYLTYRHNDGVYGFYISRISRSGRLLDTRWLSHNPNTVCHTLGNSALMGIHLRNIADYDTVEAVSCLVPLDPGFAVEQSDASTSVSESGTVDSFDVVLTAKPDTDVVLSVTGSDTDEAAVAPARLTFTPTNWDIAQAVTVTGKDDRLLDGNQTSVVTVAVVDSDSDNAFDSVADQTVVVTTADDDTPGFLTHCPDIPLEVNEAGKSATFTVVLSAGPESDVVLAISSGNPDEALADSTQIRFSPTDWDVPQTVTVHAVDDALIDGDTTATITLSVLPDLSNDKFDNLPPKTVYVHVADDDNAGLVVQPDNTTLIVSETGSSQRFSVALAAQPYSDVVLSITGSDSSEATVIGGNRITITPSTWNTPRTITVRGVDDHDIDGDVASTIDCHIVDTESDDNFNDVPDKRIPVLTEDDDDAGLVLVETGGYTEVYESGTTDAMTVALTARPYSNVVLTVAAEDTTEVEVIPTRLTFTPADWNTAQAVTVRGVNDSLVDGDQTTRVVFSVDRTQSDDHFDTVETQYINVVTKDTDVAVTWPTPAPIVYGTALTGHQLNASAAPAGTFTYDPPAGTILNAGTHRLTATFLPDDERLWEPVTVAVNIQITPAPLTCRADDRTKVYGTDNPDMTITYTGLKNHDSAPAVPPDIACGASKWSPVGTYTITLTGGADPNYTMTLKNGTLTIVKKELTVTVHDASRVYGEVNPAFTIEYDGFVNGDDVGDLFVPPTATCEATALSPAGTYPVTASGGVDENYAFSYVPGTLTVTKKTLTVTADDTSRLYGDGNPLFTVTYEGFVNGDDVSNLDTPPTVACPAAPGSPVDIYPITISGGSDRNYAFTYVEGELSILPAPLTCRADDKAKVYGTDNPDMTITYTGLKNHESTPAVPPDITCGATKWSPVGTYTITLTGGTDPNYTMTLKNGTLTIVQKELTVTVHDTTRIYGEVNPVFTLEYDGFVNGDDVGDLLVPPTAACEATALSPVGTYPVTASGGADENYAFSYVPGTLTVTKKMLTVIADDTSRLYGTGNPLFTVTYEGFANGDDASKLDTPPTVACPANPRSPVGTYPITISGGNDRNYAFTFVDGELSILPAPLTCRADDKTKVYGTNNPEMTITYTGLKNHDSVPDVPPDIACGATEWSPVGTYAITLTGGADPNYTLILKNGTLTIVKKELTVTVHDASRVYGEVNPAFTMEYDGFVNGDDVGDLLVPPTAACKATMLSPAGTYPVTASGGVDDKYRFTYIPGTLTIIPGAAMRLWLEDHDGNCIALDFGEAETATDTFDPGWDVVETGTTGNDWTAYFLNPFISPSSGQRITCDYRPCSDTTRWKLMVSVATSRQTLTLHWDVSAAEDQREVYLQEVREEQPVGFPIAMRDTASVELSGSALFELAYARTEETILSMRRGWNLVGNPLMSIQSTGEILDDGLRGSIMIGPPWYWADTRYLIWDTFKPLTSERGYWIYCPADCHSIPIIGIRADGMSRMKPGWNLVSPATDCGMPSVEGLATRAWYWDSGTYRAVSTGGLLEAGKGYWMYVESSIPILLNLGE